MNTISSLRLNNITLRNNPHAPTSQPTQVTAPAFKGQLGQQVVKDISAKKTVTATGVLALVAGMIGLNKDKVADVIESFIDSIKGLQSENENLSKRLKQEEINAARAREAANIEFAQDKQRMQECFENVLRVKNEEIAQKDATIAELEAYAGMAKVKSVEELDIVTTEQFVELLNEAKDAAPIAEQSLLTYLFKGTGQEEFLKQMERSNIILKAKQDGITTMDDMKKAYDNVGIIIGYDSAYVAQAMMEKVLKNDEVGAQLSYPPVMAQVKNNADAIINPLMNGKNHCTANIEVLKKVSKFYTDLSIKTEEFESTTKSKFESRNLDRNNIPYYTFSRANGEKIDIYLTYLVNGLFGYSRLTGADGTIINTCDFYKNL